jgi:hypothetical protein
VVPEDPIDMATEYGKKTTLESLTPGIFTRRLFGGPGPFSPTKLEKYQKIKKHLGLF